MLIVTMQSTSDKLFSTKIVTMYRTLDTNEEIISLHCIQIPEDRASVLCGVRRKDNKIRSDAIYIAKSSL